MTDNGAPKREDNQLIAAEYVLGVLGVSEWREVEQRIARDQIFDREVAFWEERLGGLAEGTPAVAPPAATRAVIWQSLTFWRGLALSTSALAAACLAALIYVGAVIPPRTPLVAQ